MTLKDLKKRVPVADEKKVILRKKELLNTGAEIVVKEIIEDGVEISEKEYSKREYKNVGVASDGLRFIVKSDDEELKNEFVELLKSDKPVKIKRFINRNQKIFKDDITIVF